MIFHPNIRNLMVGRGIVAGLSSPTSLTIYSGTQPLAADIAANWSLYNSTVASFLLHYSGVTWAHPVSGTTTFASITTFPAATAATHTGTGSWGIIWSTNNLIAAMGTATLPSSGSFIVVPVSILTGNGVIRFNPSVSFIQGTSYSIADGTLSVSST